MSKVKKFGLDWRWFVVGGLACAGLFQVGEWAGPSLGLPADLDAPPLFDPEPLSDEVRFKVPVSISQPKRGPEDALVTIVEWCDLIGEACKESDAMVVALREKYGSKIRHVWRHLDETASEDSARTHEFAALAQEQAGKFWEARALLLASGRVPSFDTLKSYASRLGMDVSSTSATLEKRTFAGGPAADQLFAARFGVAHGPAFFVNGRRLRGEPTQARLARLIDIELEHAQKLVRAGAAKNTLYDEITKSGLWSAAGASLAKSH